MGDRVPLTLRQARREARGDLSLLVCLALLTAVVAAVGALAPVLTARQEDRALRQRLAGAQRQAPLLTVAADVLGGPGNVSLPLADVLRQGGSDLVGDADRSLARALSVTRARADYPAASVPVPPHAAAGITSVQLTTSYVSDAGTHLRLVSGRAPDSTGRTPELMLSESTARLLGLNVGDRVQAAYPKGGRAYPVVYRLSGIFTQRPVGDDFWHGQAALDRPLRFPVAGSPGDQLSVRALVGAGTAEQLQRAGVPLPTLSWELRVRLDGAAVARSRPLPAALAGFGDAIAQAQCSGVDANGTPLCSLTDRATSAFRLSDRLTAALGDFRARDTQARTLLAFAAASTAAVALATLLTSIRLLLRRRGGGLRLQRARGASVAHLVALRCATALPVTALACAVGWAGGVVAAPDGTSGAPQPLVPFAAFAATALLLPLLTWAALREPPSARAARARVPLPARRLTLEALVLLLAVAAVVTLRLQGLGQGPDLQLAATPVLVAVAAVLVLLRLYPPVLAFAAARTRHGRGALGLVSLSRARADAPATSLALFVLVLTLGTAVFGGLVGRTVSTGAATAAAWTSGADAAAVTDGTTTPGPVHTAGVRAVTEQLRRLDLTGPGGTVVARAAVVSIDARALAAAEPTSPLLRLTAAAASGSTTALAGTGLPGHGSYQAGEGVAFTAVGALGPAQLRDPVLGPLVSQLPSGTPVLVTALGPTALPAQDLGATAVLLFASDARAQTLRVAAAQALGPLAEVRIRTEQAAALRDDGLIRAITAGYTAASAVSVLFCLLAVVLELLLTAADRQRTAASLRTLGLGGRAVRRLHLLQLVPLAVTAGCGGALLGACEPALLGPVLSVRQFTGGPAEPAAVLDWPLMLGLALGLGLLVLGAAALEGAATRNRPLGAYLRPEGA